MTSNSLPPEVLDLIAEVITEKKSLKNLSLVSRDWRWPSKRLLWNHLNITSGKLDELFSLLEEDEDLRGMVKMLTLGSKAEGLLIEAGMIQRLFDSLDRLREISLFSVTLVPLEVVGSELKSDEQVELAKSNYKFRFNLSHLTSFTYTVWQQDQQSHILQEVVTSAVNLTHLDLRIHALNFNFEPIRLPSNNKLRSLTLTNSSEIDILNPRRPYLPSESMSNLEELTYLQARNFDSTTGFIQLIQSNTSTLRKLIVRQQFGIYDYEDFEHLFSNFKVLEELQLYRLSTTPSNFLQILPETLKILHIPTNQEQLQHLKLESINLALSNLESINLAVPTRLGELYDLDLYKYLPDQIETVMYGMIRVDVLKAILLRSTNEIKEGRNITFKNIEILIVQKTLSVDEVFDTEKEFVRSFKELGIRLKVSRWG